MLYPQLLAAESTVLLSIVTPKRAWGMRLSWKIKFPLTIRWSRALGVLRGCIGLGLCPFVQPLIMSKGFDSGAALQSAQTALGRCGEGEDFVRHE